MQIGLGLSITAQLRFGSSLSSYAVNDFDPSLVFDFEQNYYRTGGEDSTLSSSVTHSATSNATMTDSNGIIKWRPHNLLSYSEDFTQWSIAGATVTANTIRDTSQSSTHNIVKSVTITSGSEYTFTAKVKKETSYPNAFVGFALQHVSINKNFDPVNGVLSTAGNGVGTVVDQVTHWLVHITGIATATGSKNMMILPSRNTALETISSQKSAVGLITIDYVQLERNSTPSTYVPTTSSAVYAPRVGHHIYNGSEWVNEGVLHESEARTNRVTYSNDFSNSSWDKTNVSLTASSTTSPDGLSNGWKLTTTGGSTSHCYLRIAGLRQQPTTYSIYVKKDISDYVALCAGGASKGFLINFSFASETIVDTFEYEAGSTYESSTVENAGNGWYRISLTGNSTATNNITVFPWTSATAPTNVNNNSVGNGQSVYIYGAQTEESKSTPSSYIPTSGSTVTRAAETLTVPAANMPWPTPVVTGSTIASGDAASDDTNSTGNWFKRISNGTEPEATTALEITSQSAVKNTGTYALKFAFDGTAKASGFIDLNDFSPTSGALYKLKFSAKVEGSVNLRISVDKSNAFEFNADVRILIQASSPSDWTEYEALIPASSIRYFMVRSNNQDGSTTTVYLDGLTLEPVDPLSVSMQMDGRMTYADNNTGTANSDVNGEVTLVRWKLNNVNWLGSMVNAKSPKVGQVNFRQYGSGALDFTQTADDYYNYANNPVSFNIASRHGSTFINGATDGTALTANTTPTGLPDLSASNLQLGYRFMGTIGKFRVWSEDLTDTGIEEAST